MRAHRQDVQASVTAAGDNRAAPATLSPLTTLSLHNDKVAIGPVLPEDTGAIFLWLNDVEAANMDLSYRPVDWMSYNNWLAEFGSNHAQVLFAVRHLAAPRIIGFVMFSKIHPVHRSAEIGVRIGHRADRGKGLGRHALALALAYAWNHLNLNRVQLSVFASNRPALRAYGAAGFEAEGRLRRAVFIDGDWQDVVMMAALRS